MKNNNLFYYFKQKKLLIFLKTDNSLNSLLKCFNKNINLNTLNKLIINKNNLMHTDINIHNIFNIVKKNKKLNKSYKLLTKFKKYWKHLNKNFIMNKYINSDTIYLWLAYVLSLILYNDCKKNKNDFLIYNIKENNLYIKLSNIIKENVDNLLKNKQEKLSKVLFKHFLNKKIYFRIANRIIQTCYKAKIFIKKEKKYKKKKINFIKLNHKIFNDIFRSVTPSSIQLPTLEPIIYNNSDDILINKNNNYSFHYNNNYLDALNYLNSQQMIINVDYFNYLCNLNSSEIFKFSKGLVNFKLLNDKKNKNKIYNHKLILTLIFINNMYIIDKYKNYTFYFKYKCDKRGRFYQVNWPMNSLYTKMLTPLFIFKDNDIINNIEISNFDTYYWYKSYTLNKNNVLSVRDATNSIFQISGCLLLDEKMLKYSNIHNENIRYTLYDFALDSYKTNIDSLMSIIFKKYGDIHHTYIYNIKNLDRTFIKSIIMTWCYNESYNSSLHKIYNKIFVSPKTKLWFEIIPNTNNLNIKNIFMDISKIIHKYIFDIFKINFKPYLKLRKFFNLIAIIKSKSNENIIIKHNKSDTHYFEQHHYETKLNKLFIEVLNKKRKWIYFNEINESKLSLKDNKRSLTANTIQYLDSILAVNVILQCKKKGIPIITNHDCFYTSLKYDLNMLHIYNQVLHKMFIEYDFLNDFYIHNNFDSIKYYNIHKLYKEIEYIRSKNIHNIKIIFDFDINYSISIAYKNYNT